MTIPDEMVNRAAEALALDRGTHTVAGSAKPIRVTPSDYRRARAALEAALGDVEPDALEDVLTKGREAAITFLKGSNQDGALPPWVEAIALHTADAAIRAAVANARGGAS